MRISDIQKHLPGRHTQEDHGRKSGPFSMKLSRPQYKNIVAATFPEYTGRKVKMVFKDRLTIYNTNWAGGSRIEYAAVKSDGRTALFDAPAPWSNPVEGATIDMPEDAMIVTHQIFCGHDMGITIYAHPSHLPKWIAAPKST